MSKALEFIRQCGSFFVVTMNGDFPAARPFGAIIEVGEYLYLATNDRNEAHRQLRENGNIQIVAKKPDTREWLRITGHAEECSDREIKQRFLDEIDCSELFPGDRRERILCFEAEGVC